MLSIEINNLNKKYKNIFAVKNINFKINKGKTIGLLGPNGCGKSNIVEAPIQFSSFIKHQH